MKVLITGFDPFGGESINPAWEAVKEISSSIEGAEVVKVQLSTVFRKSLVQLEAALMEHKPDIAICVGQAGGRFDITVERVAINLDDGRIADNEGNQPIDLTIYEDGDSAYFSNLPIKAMVQEIKAAGIPASVSNTAGTFVCNHVMYGLLYLFKKHSLSTRGGFIHVPYLPQQVVDKPNTPFMNACDIIKGLECSIASAVKCKEDIKAIGGREF